MGYGGSVAQMPGFDFGATYQPEYLEPEVAQWQGNPTFQQPSQYDVPFQLGDDPFAGNRPGGSGGWGSAFSMLNDPFGIGQDAAESGEFSIGGLSPATTPGQGFSRAMYPFDYVAEIGGSVTDAQVSGLNQARHGDIWGGNKTSLGGFSEAYGDLTNPNEAVEEFRARPAWQQLGYGAVFDPTAVLGIGKVDEGVDLVRRAPDLIDALRPAARYADEALPFADNVAPATHPVMRGLYSGPDFDADLPLRYALGDTGPEGLIPLAPGRTPQEVTDAWFRGAPVDDAPVRPPVDGPGLPVSRWLQGERGGSMLPDLSEVPGAVGRGLAKPFVDGPPNPMEVANEFIPGEKPWQGLLRQFEGKTKTLELELTREWQDANKLVRQAGLAKGWTAQGGQTLKAGRTPEMEDLFRALHGEGPVPPKLQGLYDFLKAAIDQETAATVGFDPSFMPRDDYFPRFWRAPKETTPGIGRGKVGATPGFAKPRVDATFDEMLASGWEPKSWNPADMLYERRLAGVEHRELTTLVDRMKALGTAYKVDGPIPEGWRVPRVGPAFEGKNYAYIPNTTGLADEASQAAVATTQRWMVPDNVANILERMYGPTNAPNVVDKVVNAATFGTKRIKLFGSLFQQIDFATRASGANMAGAIDAALRGKPIETVRKLVAIPETLGKQVLANFSPAYRRNIRDDILSGKPLFKDRPGITLKGVAERGWRQTDVSIGVRKELRDAVRNAATEGRTKELVGIPKRRLGQIERAMQNGLFDGVYPTSQRAALENFILPRLVRQHPKWTDAQIMAAGATEVNKAFSTLGEFQTVINQLPKGYGDFLRRVIFSTNETESLFRSAFSAVKGPHKRLWLEYYAGTLGFLALTAELTHKASTGEWLPTDRLNPTERGGPLGVQYNRDFLAPDIPLKGRGGTQLSIDLMGQLDTVFRVLDPKAFVDGRLAVPVRAALTQYTDGNEFTGPLDTPGKRLRQLGTDLGLPIGLGNFVGQSEVRLGEAGSRLQATGVNVRAETNPDLRQRLAEEVWGDRPGKPSWRALDSVDKDGLRKSHPEEMAELDRRTGEAAAKGNEFAIESTESKARATELTNNRLKIQEQNDALFTAGKIDGDEWRERRNTFLTDVRTRKDEIYAGIPEKDVQFRGVLDNYYAEIDKAVDPLTNKVDWDRVESYLNTISATDRARIEQAAGLSQKTAVEKEYQAARDRIAVSGYWDMRDNLWRELNAAAAVPGYDPSEGYYDWKDKVVEEAVQQMVAAGMPIYRARSEAAENIEKHPTYGAIIKTFEGTGATKPGLYKERALYPWAAANREELDLLLKWGYMDNPDSNLEKLLAQ